MIVLILIMISVLAISSSTSLLAIQQHTTRSAIIREQLVMSALGLGLIIGIYNIKRIGILKFLSQFGFMISLLMLLCLAVRINIPGVLKAQEINGAVRSLSLFGFQLHVFEFVKVFMIMYLAWAVNAYNEDKFTIANALAKTKNFAFMGKDFWKKATYIYAPIGIVCLFLMDGSMSSTLFIGFIMLATIMIGGISIKDMALLISAVALIVAAGYGIHKVSGGEVFKRFATAESRIAEFFEDPEEELMKHKRGTIEFQEELDNVRQPISAKVAVAEGGLFGKGPGKSTQKYIVPVMFGDYMFSFIVEEYGLWGALIILMLYGSLLSRGSLVAKSCDSLYAKMVVAGLTVLISGQALMHILISVDLGPMTGQTLPMISHGNSAFLAFSLAFGIILAISRLAKKKIDKETAAAKPLVEETDDLKAYMQEVDNL